MYNERDEEKALTNQCTKKQANEYSHSCSSDWSQIIHALCKLHANPVIARDSIPFENRGFAKSITNTIDMEATNSRFYLIPSALLMPINYFKLHYRLTHRLFFFHCCRCRECVFVHKSLAMQTVNMLMMVI